MSTFIHARDTEPPSGVVLTNNIKDDGRKKLLIIGKTGTGKSSLCNVITGHSHCSKTFPVSAEAVSCTQSIQFANINFNNDKGRPISLIDTIGFDDPQNDTDADIIGELVHQLKYNCDHVNLFMIAVNGQDPRLDGALMGMIRILEGMFGEEFWKQAVIVFTRLSMDEKSKKRRMNITEQTDDALAKKYLNFVEAEFPRGHGLKHLFMDACRDEDDKAEKKAFNSAMEKLWKTLNSSPPLPTTKVQAVETENKKLKNAIEEKEKERQMILEQCEKKEKEWKEAQEKLEKQRELDRKEADEQNKRFKHEMEEERKKMNELLKEMKKKQTEDVRVQKEKDDREKKVKEMELELNKERDVRVQKEKDDREKKVNEMELELDRKERDKQHELEEERKKIEGLQTQILKNQREEAKSKQQKEDLENKMKEKDRKHQEQIDKVSKRQQDDQAALNRKIQEEVKKLKDSPGFWSNIGRGAAAVATLGFSELFRLI